MWKVKLLEELSSRELLAVLRLRIDTFFYQTEHGVEAYARVFQLDDHVTFGRVVIKESLRGTGQGKALMNHVLATCHNHFPNQPIIIESQERVVPFYEKFGFETIGAAFIFEGTPHVEMKLE